MYRHSFVNTQEDSRVSIKFTVIVPVYNAQDYLKDCIESIIHQTYTNLEIILVDDGSPDDCPAICDRYAAQDPRIIVIHKANGGVTSARQAAAETATGDYICCVDSDDYIALDYIERMHDAIEEYDADIVCCNFCFASEDGIVPDNRVKYSVYNRSRIESEIFPALLQTVRGTYFHPTIWAKAIKRELFSSVQKKVDKSLWMGEDQAVSVPCVYQSSMIVTLEECLYYYRYNPQSATRRGSAMPWDGLKSLMAFFREEINMEEADFQAQYDRRVAHDFYGTAKSQFNRKEPYSVIRADIMSHMNDPFFSTPIQNSHFHGSIKMKLIDTCLKHKWVFPIWVASIIK